MNDLFLYCGPESNVLAQVKHQAQARAMAAGGQEFPAPKPYTLQGSVATVDIGGSLVSGSAGFMSLFGYTGYSDIRNSLVAAVSDQAVGSILLNVDSGGGEVSGVHELAQLIARVDKVKPVVTYTGGTMASAALWSGAGGRRIFASETAMVGSVGVIQVHIDRSAQLEAEGLKATVVRSGEDKALANSMEPLSEKARAEMESQGKELHSIFLGHMAAQRGMPTTVAQEKFGTGKMFVGKQAVEAGLVDEIGGFEAAYSYAAKLADRAVKKAASNTQNVRTNMPARAGVDGAAVAVSADNSANTNRSTKVDHENLSPEALAALAGVDLAYGVSAEAAAQVAAQAEADKATALAEAEAARTALADATAQLAEANTKLADLTAQLEAAKAQADASKPQFDAAIEIVRSSLRTMGASLGVRSEQVAAMSASEVLEQHTALAEKFRAKFRVKAGSPAATSSTPTTPAVTPQFMAPALASVAISLPGAM